MRIGLLLFITIPILEMFLLIKVGSLIGALPTIGLVVLTATLGIWLLKLEGLATLQQVQLKLNRGEIPGQELLEGIMLVIGGALLLTPGFFTDTIGFICLIPGFRKPLARWLISRGMLQSGVFSSGVQFGSSRFGAGASHSVYEETTIIEGEYEDQSSAGHQGTPHQPGQLSDGSGSTEPLSNHSEKDDRTR